MTSHSPADACKRAAPKNRTRRGAIDAGRVNPSSFHTADTWCASAEPVCAIPGSARMACRACVTGPARVMRMQQHAASERLRRLVARLQPLRDGTCDVTVQAQQS